MSDRTHRDGAPRRWTPVDQLSELARGLLSDDLGGRDAVPGHVADRVTALAAQWTEHGFTARTVRPWADLTPACAAYLAGRGVQPHQLDQLVDTGGSSSPVTLRTALITGQVDAEQAYDLLVPADNRPSPERDQPAPADPPAPATPAPAVFSHAKVEETEDRDGAERRGRAQQPTRTPFRT